MKSLFLKFMRWIGFEPVSNRRVFRGWVSSKEMECRPDYTRGETVVITKLTIIGYADVYPNETVEFELNEVSVLP